jgi:hypothetical protein
MPNLSVASKHVQYCKIYFERMNSITFASNSFIYFILYIVSHSMNLIGMLVCLTILCLGFFWPGCIQKHFKCNSHNQASLVREPGTYLLCFSKESEIKYQDFNIKKIYVCIISKCLPVIMAIVLTSRSLKLFIK